MSSAEERLRKAHVLADRVRRQNSLFCWECGWDVDGPHASDCALWQLYRLLGVDS